MIFLIQLFIWGVAFTVAFVVFTLPVTIPIALWIYIQDHPTEHSLHDWFRARAVRKANRLAELEYVKSLSPDDQKAYWRHKERKVAYLNLPPLQPFKEGSWDDVVKAPDHGDENLDSKDPFRKWEPPKWR